MDNKFILIIMLLSYLTVTSQTYKPRYLPIEKPLLIRNFVKYDTVKCNCHYDTITFRYVKNQPDTIKK